MYGFSTRLKQSLTRAHMRRLLLGIGHDAGAEFHLHELDPEQMWSAINAGKPI